MAETEYQSVPRTESEMLNLLNDLETPLEGNIHRDIVGNLFELILRSMVNAGYTDVQVEMAKGRFKDLASRLDASDADMRNINVNWINKNLGKLDQTYMTEEFLQQMAGNTPINAVPADGSLTTPKYSDKSVTPEKTEFLETKGRNLFDKNAVKVESDGRLSSQFIKIEVNSTYHTNLPAVFNVYDKSGNLVTAGIERLNVGAAASNPYFKIVFDAQYIDEMMLAKTKYTPSSENVSPPKFEPYNYGEVVYAFDRKVDIPLSGLEGVSYYRGLNLFDKSKVEIDNQQAVSELLKIEANTTFHTNHPANFYIYKADGSLSSVVNNRLNIADTFTNPHFKIVFDPQYIDDMILAKTTYTPSNEIVLPPKYEPYTGGEEVYAFDKKLLIDVNNDKDKVVKNEPYELYLPDFSGTDEPWHPSVIYIKGGFAGYKYWLVQSVYPNNPDLNEQKDRYEVPIVYKSNDGINWLVVANPIDDLTEAEIDNKDYMSDPHIVYNNDLKQLEVWYRLTRVVGATLPTTIFRKVTQDGEVWTEREITVPETLHTAPDFARSPSFVYDNGIYKMWKTNNEGIYYQESTDAKNWTAQTLVTAPGASDGTVGKRWHIDVGKYATDDGFYHMTVYNMDSNTIEHYAGEDGLNFEFKGTVLKIGNGQSDLHNTRLYKSASMLDELGNVRLYFSGTGTRHTFANGEYKANVGVYISPSWDEVVNIKESESEKLQRSLLDLQAQATGIELTRMNYKVDSHSRI